MQHDMCKELCRVYGIYIGFYGSQLLKHTIFNECITLQWVMAASKKMPLQNQEFL